MRDAHTGTAHRQVATGDASVRDTHTVEPDDTLWDVAERYYGDGTRYDQIQQATPRLDEGQSHVEPGWELVIPDLDGRTGDARAADAETGTTPGSGGDGAGADGRDTGAGGGRNGETDRESETGDAGRTGAAETEAADAGTVEDAADAGTGTGTGARDAAADRSDDELISDAIDLYAASTHADTGLGGRIESRLEELHETGNVGFDDLQGDRRGVTWGETNYELTTWVEVDTSVRDQLPLLSLTLVHEAVHTLKRETNVAEELAARNAELDYYEQLEQGIDVDGLSYDVGEQTVRMMDEQLRHREFDQLVDYVLDQDAHGDDTYSLDAEWVATHFDDWRGIEHRWDNTKAVYLETLVDDADSHSDYVITILETEADSGAELEEFLAKADYDVADMREYVSDEHMLYATGYYRRLERIEEQTGVDLGVRGDDQESDDGWFGTGWDF